MLIKGWLKAQLGATAENRRARYFKLTPAARKQLELEVEDSDFERLRAAVVRVIQTA